MFVTSEPFLLVQPDVSPMLFTNSVQLKKLFLKQLHFSPTTN